MAQKRMFNRAITNDDNFIEMPMSSQVLYFHLSMNADDDGFVNNWKSIMRMIGAKEDDLKVLIAKNYIIPFDSGVIVIKHWRLNNYLRNDRYVETKYKEEKRKLLLDSNQVYQMDTNGIPSIDKISIDKNSIDIYGEFKNVKLTKNEYNKLKENNLLPYIEKLSAYMKSKGKQYKSHYATILNWSRKDKSSNNDIIPKWMDKDIDSSISNKEKEEMDEILKEIGG